MTVRTKNLYDGNLIMMHSNPHYRTFLLLLATLTLFFLMAAAMTFIFLSDAGTTTIRDLKTEPTSKSIIKNVENNNSQTKMIQSADLRQFSRMLYGISLARDARNTATTPIPYFLEEEGKNSIVYFYGEVPIRCWLEMSNDTTQGKQCPAQVKNVLDRK